MGFAFFGMKETLACEKQERQVDILKGRWTEELGVPCFGALSQAGRPCVLGHLLQAHTQVLSLKL